MTTPEKQINPLSSQMNNITPNGQQYNQQYSQQMQVQHTMMTPTQGVLQSTQGNSQAMIQQ